MVTRKVNQLGKLSDAEQQIYTTNTVKPTPRRPPVYRL
jgi:hypothetical protein